MPGTTTKSALRALDLSPAVVTRLVADLEDHLGTRLLQRTTRKQSLTAAGETYLARVRSILQDIDEAHSLASAHTHELSGTLHVLVPPVLATHLVAPLLAGFRQAYPAIVLDLTVELYKEPPIEDFDITLFAAAQDHRLENNFGGGSRLPGAPGHSPAATGPGAARLPALQNRRAAPASVAPGTARRAAYAV